MASNSTTANNAAPATVSSRPSDSRSSRVKDPFYGHEEISKLCTRFLMHLFQCPDLQPSSTAVSLGPSPPLADFIAYAIHRTEYHLCVTFAALFLLQRLKGRFPAVSGSSGHRLFITALMLASKVIIDITYPSKSWSIVAQRMFTAKEMNQMEREMCSYLEWQLNIDPTALEEFEAMLCHVFNRPGPYLTYVVPPFTPSPLPSATPFNALRDGMAPTPSFVVSAQDPSSGPPPNPMPPPVPVHTATPRYSLPLSANTSGTTDTPDSLTSHSTSPVSSGSPSTPAEREDHSVQIAISGTIGAPMDIDSRPLTSRAGVPHTSTASTSAVPRNAPDALKKPTAGNIYARATPCVW